MLSKLFSFYTLRKYRRTLRHSYRIYRRKSKSLSAASKEHLQFLLTNLQAALNQKDAETARTLSRSLEESTRRLMPKTLWDHTRDLVSALVFALVVAIAIRQMWFELYSIPSGSMRPTLKEEDLLLVSKTDFGINTVTRTSHLSFDPNLVQRGSIVIFSVENMDVTDPDTMYFLIIPGKKQYVKRLIGKPGDTLYFYGGQIYGIDAEGHDLPELRDSPWIQDIEHIPFIRFDGKAETSNAPQQGIYSPVVFNQMNEPVARLTKTNGKISGEMLAPVKNYSDLWGFKNFAMARLLTASQIKQLYEKEGIDLEAAPLYLELTHHPSLFNATLGRDEYRRMRPELATSVSFIPLNDAILENIMRHMTTCRFTVKDGIVARFGASFESSSLPRMKGVPNGTYEVQDGKAYRVLWSGLSYRLSDDHPVLMRDAKQVQLLYNLGIEWDTHFLPDKSSPYFPSRYAYFRGGDLYLLGAPIIQQTDPAMALFLKQEQQKRSPTYEPFTDQGPPLTKEGALDAAFIRKFGLKVPEHMYLVLGDNHAMSADSRHFGFVPQDNLRGGASFLLWPPGPRWGRLPQPSIAHLTWPNLTIWGLFFLCSIASIVYLHRKYSRPLKF
jgi:signal peptidase I